jgi:import receptor subunit TOM20
MVLEMMRLDVSEPPPPPVDVDTLPHATISEDDGSTSKRGPPSEASSQDWDRVTDPGPPTPSQDWDRVTDPGNLTPPTS